MQGGLGHATGQTRSRVACRQVQYEEDAGQAANRSLPRSDLLANASTRIWLGNIASHVTSRTLKTIFLSHGYVLTDVAVFPARIGPLGYAFINFPTLEQAVDAYTRLQNVVIPAITASKQLKMRFKPIQVQSNPYLPTCGN